MKKTGLSNRFSPEVRSQWTYWHKCMVCKLNMWDALHHIVSPSSKHYVRGKHNESVLNSCPIHNYTHPNAKQTKPCHVGNEAWLYREENIKYLLYEVVQALMNSGYKLKPIDKEFAKIYSHLYE